MTNSLRHWHTNSTHIQWRQLKEIITMQNCEKTIGNGRIGLIGLPGRTGRIGKSRPVRPGRPYRPFPLFTGSVSLWR